MTRGKEWYSFYPQADFFNSPLRARQLRETGVSIIKAIDALTRRPEEGVIIGARELQQQNLEKYREELVKLGITPRMHEDKRSALIQKWREHGPVVLAEWVTSRLLPYTTIQLPSEDEVRRIYEEFFIRGPDGRELPTDPQIIKSAPLALRKHLSARTEIDLDSRFLDVDIEA